jgi:integrase
VVESPVERRQKMAVNRVTDRKGRTRIEVRKRWPDGTEYRRYFRNMTTANQAYYRIEDAIARDEWAELKQRLIGHGIQDDDLTVAELSVIYLDKYCRVYNKRPDFKEQVINTINRVLGDVKLKDCSKADADRFIAERRKEVEPATVNRGLAVLKNMMTFAVDRGYLESNPLAGLSLLPEDELPLRIMTLEEERQLIQAVLEHNPVIAAYAAVLGETGLRKSEGLRMEWEHLDWLRKVLTVPRSKTGVPRYVPLSAYALEWIGSLIHYSDSPWVFTLPSGRPLKDPRESFEAGKTDAGLDWVRGFHDLRHFRATQWLIHGVDIQTVKHYLGHKRIETTMRYLHFVPGHAESAIREAQKAEAVALERAQSRENVA